MLTMEQIPGPPLPDLLRKNRDPWKLQREAELPSAVANTSKKLKKLTFVQFKRDWILPSHRQNGPRERAERVRGRMPCTSLLPQDLTWGPWASIRQLSLRPDTSSVAAPAECIIISQLCPPPRAHLWPFELSHHLFSRICTLGWKSHPTKAGCHQSKSKNSQHPLPCQRWGGACLRWGWCVTVCRVYVVRVMGVHGVGEQNQVCCGVVGGRWSGVRGSWMQVGHLRCV